MWIKLQYVATWKWLIAIWIVATVQCWNLIIFFKFSVKSILAMWRRFSYEQFNRFSFNYGMYITYVHSSVRKISCLIRFHVKSNDRKILNFNNVLFAEQMIEDLALERQLFCHSYSISFISNLNCRHLKASRMQLIRQNGTINGKVI